MRVFITLRRFSFVYFRMERGDSPSPGLSSRAAVPQGQGCNKGRSQASLGSALAKGAQRSEESSQLLQAHVLGLRPTGFVHILAGDSMCVCHGWSGRGPVGAADPGPLRRCQAVLCQSPTPVRVRGRCLRNTVANQIP